MDIFQSELSGLSKDNITRLHEMKERSEELKSAREEKRKQLAADLLYEQWKKNDPKLRQVLTLLQTGRPPAPCWTISDEPGKYISIRRLSIKQIDYHYYFL